MRKILSTKKFTKCLLKALLSLTQKSYFLKNKDASTQNKGDFDASQISGECGLLSKFKSLLNGPKPRVVIAVGKEAKRWLFSESIRNILQTRSISFYFVCHPHYVYTSRGIYSFPGSATWFFRNCIVKSVEYCGGFVNFIQDYFTEETDGGRNGLRTFGMLMPGPTSPIVQKHEMNLYLLNRFFKLMDT